MSERMNELFEPVAIIEDVRKLPQPNAALAEMMRGELSRPETTRLTVGGEVLGCGVRPPAEVRRPVTFPHAYAGDTG
jgi:hypothetical protein